MQGNDIHAAAKLLGHKDLRMAARYQHLNTAYLQKASRLLDDVFSPALADVCCNDGVTIQPLNGHKPALTITKLLPV